MESLRGRLLISSGGLYDPNFRHTVVLIGEHNADGALGVVLNRPLEFTVEEAFPTLRDLVPCLVPWGFSWETYRRTSGRALSGRGCTQVTPDGVLASSKLKWPSTVGSLNQPT